MNKEVLISIKGTVVSENGTPDVIELVTAGKYYKREGSYYISYKESETTGMSGVTTILKVDGSDSVTLIRNGSQKSRLLLETGRRHQSYYDTGYGAMLVGVSGCRVTANLGDLGGELQFHYTLDINSNTISQNEVFVSVREAKEQHVKSVGIRN